MSSASVNLSFACVDICSGTDNQADFEESMPTPPAHDGLSADVFNNLPPEVLHIKEIIYHFIN